jgi:hypothetical protein
MFINFTLRIIKSNGIIISADKNFFYYLGKIYVDIDGLDRDNISAVEGGDSRIVFFGKILNVHPFFVNEGINEFQNKIEEHLRLH